MEGDPRARAAGARTKPKFNRKAPAAGRKHARPKVSAASHAWAQAHFGSADLSDLRRTRRLVKVVGVMADQPSDSIPRQCGSWADAIGVYRLLSNSRVKPHAIQEPHRELTLEACRGAGVVLCVQDTTDLDFSSRKKTDGLGSIGNGKGRGILQHSALAVCPRGRVMGLLACSWHKRVERPKGETAAQRKVRWTEADVWADTARSVGETPEGCVLIQVGDRHADVFRFMAACRGQKQGFIVRAMHDRKVDEGQARLWEKLESLPLLGTRRIWVDRQLDKQGRLVREAGEVELEVRAAAVRIPAPQDDPKSAGEEELVAWGVMLSEPSPPAGVEPIEWTILTDQKVEGLEDAQRVVGYYSRRWVIEEWHRALKEGCRLERSQLDEAEDIQRLAAIQSVVAVRLLQMRDLAEAASPREPGGEDPKEAARREALANDPGALRQVVPAMFILAVAKLAGCAVGKVTPRLFWRTLAMRGGWLGRKGDGRPGWKTVLGGWQYVNTMIEGAELFNSTPGKKRSV